MLAIVSLDSLSCEVPCLILHSVVYRDATRQAKGLYHLKYVGALERGLAYLRRCNLGWFCHITDPGIYRDFGWNRPKTVAGLRDMMHDLSEQEEKMRERFPRRNDSSLRCRNDNCNDKSRRDYLGLS
jgi:hypothetical protein